MDGKAGHKRRRPPHVPTFTHAPKLFDNDEKKGPSLKNRIRSLQRLLAKPDLPKPAQLDKKRLLKKLLQQQEDSKFTALEYKMGARYHRVKFFERQKITRAINKVHRLIAKLTGEAAPAALEEEEGGGESSEEEAPPAKRKAGEKAKKATLVDTLGVASILRPSECAALAACKSDEKRAEAARNLLSGLQEDLLYIKWYPRHCRYIALLPTLKQQATEADGEASDEESEVEAAVGNKEERKRAKMSTMRQWALANAASAQYLRALPSEEVEDVKATIAKRFGEERGEERGEEEAEDEEETPVKAKSKAASKAKAPKSKPVSSSESSDSSSESSESGEEMGGEERRGDTKNGAKKPAAPSSKPAPKPSTKDNKKATAPSEAVEAAVEAPKPKPKAAVKTRVRPKAADEDDEEGDKKEDVVDDPFFVSTGGPVVAEGENGAYDKDGMPIFFEEPPEEVTEDSNKFYGPRTSSARYEREHIHTARYRDSAQPREDRGEERGGKPMDFSHLSDRKRRRAERGLEYAARKEGNVAGATESFYGTDRDSGAVLKSAKLMAAAAKRQGPAAGGAGAPSYGGQQQQHRPWKAAPARPPYQPVQQEIGASGRPTPKAPAARGMIVAPPVMSSLKPNAGHLKFVE